MSNFQERFTMLVDSYPGTDVQLAKKIGVSKQTVSAWKSGERSPRKPTIIAVADKCNVSLEWLMGFDVPREKQEPQPDTTLTDQDIDAIAQRVASYQAPAATPKTVEARIVSFGIDQLPKEERERLLNMFRAMYANHPELFKKEGKNDET